MTISKRDNGTTGFGVDKRGDSLVDPTENVIALTEAAVRRQDDLRDADRRWIDAESGHIREMQSLRAAHQRELDKAETERLDAIRQVDREDVAKSAAAAQTAIATLAAVTTTMAETLRKEVANTAVATENRQTTFATDVVKRVSALELSSSEGKGKSAITDPALAEMLIEIKALRVDQAVGGGRSQGISATWGILLGVVALIGVLVSIGSVIFASRPATPTMYVPAPVVAKP